MSAAEAELLGRRPACDKRVRCSGSSAVPVATMLITLAAALLGILAFPNLPVAPLPEADFLDDPRQREPALAPAWKRWRRRWRRLSRSRSPGYLVSPR